MEDELARQGGFESQVKMLRGTLEDESRDIQKYLKEKEEFEKQRLKVDKKVTPTLFSALLFSSPLPSI